MAKYLAFSIDDGTVYDKETIALFTRLGIRGTFNLNSGLSDYVWYLGDTPIRRLDHENDPSLYEDMEVASHSLTHPDLAYCHDEEVIRQVKEDKENLERFFRRKIKGFATPFSSCGEREVGLIKSIQGISYIRLSEMDESFDFPLDPYHFKVTALDIDRALELLPRFIQRQEDGLFLYAGHSYDFALAKEGFFKLETFIRAAKSSPDIEILALGEASSRIFKSEDKP